MEYVMNNIMERDTNSDLIDEKVEPVSVRLNNEILCDFKVWE
ncbi:MAG: hypothetical protein ACJATK_002094 [Paracoccaceae bacterium]|jgi:hypothetical protein